MSATKQMRVFQQPLCHLLILLHSTTIIPIRRIIPGSITTDDSITILFSVSVRKSIETGELPVFGRVDKSSFLSDSQFTVLRKKSLLPKTFI
jgi:hypothetical protein